MSTQNRIIEIGYDSYVLPQSMTDADVMKLLALMPILMSARSLDRYTKHIPDKDSEYAESALVFGNGALKVELKITPCAVMTVAEFEAKRTAGQAEYDLAHPKPAPVAPAAVVLDDKPL